MEQRSIEDIARRYGALSGTATPLSPGSTPSYSVPSARLEAQRIIQNYSPPEQSPMPPSLLGPRPGTDAGGNYDIPGAPAYSGRATPPAAPSPAPATTPMPPASYTDTPTSPTYDTTSRFPYTYTPQSYDTPAAGGTGGMFGSRNTSDPNWMYGTPFDANAAARNAHTPYNPDFVYSPETGNLVPRWQQGPTPTGTPAGRRTGTGSSTGNIDTEPQDTTPPGPRGNGDMMQMAQTYMSVSPNEAAGALASLSFDNPDMANQISSYLPESIVEDAYNRAMMQAGER